MNLRRLSLTRLDVRENGSLAKTVAATLSVSLIYPRSGYPLLVTVKKLGDIADGHQRDFGMPNPSTGLPYTWNDTILFKEEIDGEAYLSVQVKIGKSGVEKFLDGLMKGVFGAAAGTIASPYVAVLGDSLVKAIFDTKDDDDLQTIATGSVLLREAFVGPLVIPLVAPADVKQRGPVIEGPNTVIKELTLLTKNQANGSVTIDVS